MNDLDPFTTGIEWAEAIRSQQVSPTEVLELYLERVDSFNPQLNAFTMLAADQARTEGAAKTKQLAQRDDQLPPFFGVPLPIKGLNDVRGWPNQRGSRGVPADPRPSDDVHVARLRAAGFVFMGLTTTPEFGSVSVTESAHTGATRNPWNPSHSPGGSSGGAAAAVAAGMAPLAHGSDGGGSIRGPASFCGLVGLKPSRGRIPGPMTRGPQLATEGVLTRTVADTAAALDVLAPGDTSQRTAATPTPSPPFADAPAQDPGPLKIGVHRRPGFPVVADTDAITAVETAAEQLAASGHRVEEIDLPFDQDHFEHLFITAWIASHASATGVEIDKCEPLARELHRRAGDLDPRAAADISTAMQELTTRCVAPWTSGDLDIVITPTTPSGPPPIGWLFEHAERDPMSALERAYHHAGFTALFNVFGLPAISLPIARRSDGLPQGVQFIAGPNAERLLLELAGQVERTNLWPLPGAATYAT